MSAVSRRWGWGLALAFVLGGSLVLRLWGIKQGLPYAFNTDENNHFVRQAIAFSNHDLNPHYFSNPPAFTYLLHIVFAIWFGGRAALSHAFATNPTAVFVVGRATSAALGTLAVWLLYVAGKRLVDRRVGLLAAALLGVAFLPVFYAHLALNDAPTLAPIALSLVGTAGVLRFGRPVDYLVAGVGLGLACATKYTGGIMVVPLAAAAASQYLAPGGPRRALVGDVPDRQPLLGARLRHLLQQPATSVDGGRRRSRQAWPVAPERHPLLSRCNHLGPGVGARAGRARRCGCTVVG
jgi:hypothetical protein